MGYFPKFHVALLLLILLGLASHCLCNKKVNCRKYVYAPVCRGVAAKRALPKLSNSISRESMGETAALDVEIPAQWRDKDQDVSDKRLLHIILEKLEPKPVDYYDSTES